MNSSKFYFSHLLPLTLICYSVYFLNILFKMFKTHPSKCRLITEQTSPGDMNPTMLLIKRIESIDAQFFMGCNNRSGWSQTIDICQLPARRKRIPWNVLQSCWQDDHRK